MASDYRYAAREKAYGSGDRIDMNPPAVYHDVPLHWSWAPEFYEDRTRYSPEPIPGIGVAYSKAMARTRTLGDGKDKDKGKGTGDGKDKDTGIPEARGPLEP